MPLKKHSFNDDEEPIFDEAVIYKRGEYWQMRMWLAKEGKYARFSLKTRNKCTAVDKAKLHYHELKAKELAGKTYFSITTKIGVERYLEQRELEVGQAVGIACRKYNLTIHSSLNKALQCQQTNLSNLKYSAKFQSYSRTSPSQWKTTCR